MPQPPQDERDVLHLLQLSLGWPEGLGDRVLLDFPPEKIEAIDVQVREIHGSNIYLAYIHLSPVYVTVAQGRSAQETAAWLAQEVRALLKRIRNDIVEDA